MNKFFCKIFKHTWVHKTENPKVAWNTGKSLSELVITTEGEGQRFWLECQRCQERIEHPTKEDLRNAM
jgi:hypothetical protein